MRYFPTAPLEFASPFGNWFDADMSRSRGVSAPFAQSTTAFARCMTSRFCASKYTTPVTRPRESV